MEALLQLLSSIHPLSNEGLEAFSQKLKYKELSKKALLLKAGHICQHIYFIHKGLLRCFYYHGDAEVCSWFMREGDVIISVESFFRQVASYESIQALEDCELFYMEYKDLQHIYRQYPEFNFVARVLTEKYYCLSEQRLFSIRMMRSQERYEYLTEHHPELVSRVPAKHLASYLGITEVMLSIIKNR
jgi:CRP-like cAMP-binding protein